ncbi:MAG TPA: hypothetical protein VF142_20065 [Longimicrobium sp.]
MLYTGREKDPRTDAGRTPADERRTFARRIDCADGGRARQPVNPSPTGRTVREPLQAGGTRRRLDID